MMSYDLLGGEIAGEDMTQRQIWTCWMAIVCPGCGPSLDGTGAASEEIGTGTTEPTTTTSASAGTTEGATSSSEGGITSIGEASTGGACGDGSVDAGEACDDGNRDVGDGCDDVCVLEVCGDGIVNNGGLEQCDDGDVARGDECDASCALAVDTDLPAEFDLMVNDDRSSWSYRFGLTGLEQTGDYPPLPTVSDIHYPWSPIDAPTLVWNTGNGGAPPLVGVNDTDSDLSYQGVVVPRGALYVHPPYAGVVVLSWRNDAPVREIDIEATFSDADSGCGDGVDWWIVHDGAVLASGSIKNGSSGPVGATDLILGGERIHFVIGNEDGLYDCDTTLVSARVRTHVR